MDKPERPEYNPKILQAVLLLLLYILVFTLVPGVFFISLFEALGLKDNLLLIETISKIVGFFLLLFWINRRYQLNLKKLFSLTELKIGYIVPMIIIVVGVSILLSELDNLLRVFIPMNNNWAELFENFTKSDPLIVWKSILLAVIIAPLVEEVLFRGILLKGFLKHYQPHRAIAISALFFGLFHLNPWQFWAGVAWGVVAGWWFYETRSLLPCILGHALANSLSFIAVDLLGLDIPGYTISYKTMVFQPLWFDLLGVGLLAIGIWSLIFLFKNKRSIGLIQ